jgi:hypothetical protein
MKWVRITASLKTRRKDGQLGGRKSNKKIKTAKWDKPHQKKQKHIFLNLWTAKFLAGDILQNFVIKNRL